MPIRDDDDDDDAEKIIYNCSTALSKSRLLKINRIISRNPISLTATIVSSSEAVIREEVRERTKRIRLISEFGLIWRSEEDGMMDTFSPWRAVEQRWRKKWEREKARENYVKEGRRKQDHAREKKEGEGRERDGGRGWEAVERNARSRLRLIGKKIALARRR